MEADMNTLDEWRAGTRVPDAESMMAAGRTLAALLPENRVLLLSGDLGSGKTTLVKGLAGAWGITEGVASPSYNICLIHQGDRQLVHVDAYRMKHARAMDGLLIDEFLKDPWCVAVEWPEMGICDWMEAVAWRISLWIAEDGAHWLRLTGCPDLDA